MCKPGKTVGVVVPIQGELSYTGKRRWAWKEVDSCIAHIVRRLNQVDIYTTGSCCGHGKQPPTIQLEDGNELVWLRGFGWQLSVPGSRHPADPARNFERVLIHPPIDISRALGEQLTPLEEAQRKLEGVRKLAEFWSCEESDDIEEPIAVPKCQHRFMYDAESGITECLDCGIQVIPGANYIMDSPSASLAHGTTPVDTGAGQQGSDDRERDSNRISPTGALPETPTGLPTGLHLSSDCPAGVISDEELARDAHNKTVAWLIKHQGVEESTWDDVDQDMRGAALEFTRVVREAVEAQWEVAWDAHCARHTRDVKARYAELVEAAREECLRPRAGHGKLRAALKRLDGRDKP